MFLEPIGELGGAERCLLDLMYALQTRDSQIDQIVICGSDGPFVSEAAKLGVRTIIMPLPKQILELGDSGLVQRLSKADQIEYVWRAISALWQANKYATLLSAKLASIQPSVIHSNGIKFHILTRMARIKGVPVILHLRDFIKSRPLASHALRWSAATATHAIAISKAVAKESQLMLGPIPISVVYDAIDVQEFNPSVGHVADLDRLAGLTQADAGTIRIGLVATYARWKGHEVFLEAAAQVVSNLSGTPIRFFIIGGAIYRTGGSQLTEQSLREKVRSLHLEAYVGFIPFQERIAEIYRGLDIVVHASTQPEPFGRTIAEAMACQKSVIVSASGGASEIFLDGINALGFSPGDSESLASKIRTMLDNPAERERLSLQARITAAQRFSRERLAEEVLNVYQHAGIRIGTSS